MQVTTVPETRPDVIITMSWKDARILKSILSKIVGKSLGRGMIDTLFGVLGAADIESDLDVKFSGSFQ